MHFGKKKLLNVVLLRSRQPLQEASGLHFYRKDDLYGKRKRAEQGKGSYGSSVLL